MRAGKAYISSLGTTGLLIASSLLLLAVVGALLAFDRWPDHAAAQSDVVAIAPAPGSGAEPPRAAPDALADAATAAARGVDPAGAAVAARAVSPSAARATAVQVGADADSIAAAPADPVVSDLPAPQSVPVAPTAPPSPTPPAPADPPAPDAPRPSVPGLPASPSAQPDLEDLTGPLGDVLAPGSPIVAESVRQTGSRFDAAVSQIVESTTGTR